MQDLGMYCDTAIAATEASRPERRPKKNPAAAA
jgi:hypothetical protein